ncbi:MAG: hypothetical protein L3J73_03520, partial [Thermoplasmata archaeon]|nr:hypothetical protein [Thermoplasmata archaeon]
MLPTEARSTAPAPSGRTATAAKATFLLIALRTAYAYNWFSIGPGLPAISTEFGVPTSAWGPLVAAFLVGA